MTHRVRVLPAAAVLALVAFLTSPRPAQAQTTEVVVGKPATLELPRTARVEVYGGNGHVWLKKSATARVVVTVVKSQLAANVPVQIVKTPEGVKICAVYPSDDPKKPHTCMPASGGQIYEGNPTRLPEIGINVELPEGMAAYASIGAGEVRSDHVTGDVVLYSDRGRVTVYDGGVGQVQASVGLLGNILARLNPGKQRREIDLNSPGMGRVHVIMPRELSVRYSISTQRAPRIDPAFGITVKQGQGLILGSTSPLATEVVLNVNTGITGEFMLARPTVR